MALIRFTRASSLSPAEAWRRVTRWERHADRVPLTRITVHGAPPWRAGTRFTARTGLGRLGFDDPMEVEVWRPPDGLSPGLCRIGKRGRLVTGRAEITIRARPGGCEVEWCEPVRVTGLPRQLDPVLEVAGRWVFGRVVAALLAAG